MKGYQSRIKIDVETTALSSESRVYKTERFVKATSRYKDIDLFLSKLAEGIIPLAASLSHAIDATNPDSCFRIDTLDGEHSFFFKLGQQLALEETLFPKDIVFFSYLSKDTETLRRNDQRIINYLKMGKSLELLLSTDSHEALDIDFKKLYRLSNSDYVNFPLLNHEQRKIVEIEDQNVLVQGVAGSGKTNVCIDKIIFTACREYRGKVLYTTYSRGLLIDTETKVGVFINNLKRFVSDYEGGKIIFLDDNHKAAIEYKLGVYFSCDDDDKICDKVKKIIQFLENKVDYFLLSDIYSRRITDKQRVVDENYFVKTYINDIKNHQVSGKLSKVSQLSYEVIYKEIYGMIFGRYDLSSPADMMTLADYTASRKDSFSTSECEIIYLLAKDYAQHLARNQLVDNNLISRKLLEIADTIPKYSLAIVDETQDMTEVNLCILKKLSVKMFCLGDALQMINPSYFSFAYLKRLLFEKDVVSVAELSHNYRNTKKIADVIEELGKINTAQFGLHSFIIKGDSVDSDVPTMTVYVEGKGFIEEIPKRRFDNFTVIVATAKQKESLRRLLKSQEILTVSEVKGLERDVVVLYNVLSDNFDKWQALKRTIVNRKQADENSVYRYYFNLFYVGISRARTHIYVVEESNVDLFDELFITSFDIASKDDALKSLEKTVSTVEIEQDEVLERVHRFISLEQFDNARFATNKIVDDLQRTSELTRIDIHEKYIHDGRYREAGIAFWEAGMIDEAKKQFMLSHDTSLIELIDACSQESDRTLNLDILQFFADMENNAVARRLILDTLNKDLAERRTVLRNNTAAFKRIKEKSNKKG